MSGRLESEPWFADALPQLSLRPGGRVLMLTVGAPVQVDAILERIGADGTLTIVEPDEARLDHVRTLQHEGLTALGYVPDGGESFGSYDVLVASPLRCPPWADSMWADLARGNLRPGGRLLIDLPGERHCSAAAEAWLEIGGPEETLDSWNGPSEHGLARSLSASGLRNVEAFATSHLLQFDTAHDAAECLLEMMGAAPEPSATADRVEDLKLTLARRCREDGSLEMIFQRSRVLGMR